MRATPATASALGARVRRRGFTLLEVIMALSIALGLLAVVLFFYQQASRLRDATLADTSRLAAVRLCLDRLATELRTASTRPGTFRGGPQSIEFVQCDSASPASWVAGSNTIGVVDRFPVRRIRYAGRALDESGSVNGNVSGVDRSEEPLVPATPAAAPDDTDLAGDESTGTESTGTNAFPMLDTLTETNTDLVLGATNQTPVTAVTTGDTGMFIAELQYLRLRYWDGTAWLDSWTASGLPRGVEVSLATEGLPADAAPDALPSELFRRVIALPTALNEVARAGGASSEDDAADRAGSATDEDVP